jgi:hypothetical protein
LKHTRKHERRREESNQRTKLSASGGLSGQAGRTVRKGRADSPARYRGQSARDTRTVRSGAMDRLLKTTEPPEPTQKNGPSAKTGRTVRAGSGPSATEARTVREPAATKTSNKTGSKAKARKNTTNTRRTHSPRTVRHCLADCPRRTDIADNCSTPRVNSPNPSLDLPNGRSY